MKQGSNQWFIMGLMCIGLGYYLAKKHNTKETKLLDKINKDQYVGFALLLVGLLMFAEVTGIFLISKVFNNLF